MYWFKNAMIYRLTKSLTRQVKLRSVYSLPAIRWYAFRLDSTA